jgi:5-methylcytosine-specific restriction endonuclease McrA
MTKEEKAAYDREYRAKNKARVAENKRRYAAENAEQERARVIAWHAANAERVAEIKSAWRERNAEQMAEYESRPDVRERRKEYMRQYRRTKPEVAREAGRLRARGLSHATPPWANKGAIKAIYAEARTKNLQVDHIIPLRHPLICGLHVESNLQILTAMENRRKGNRYAP